MIKVLVIGTNSYIAQQFYQYNKRKSIRSLNISMVSASNGEWERVDLSAYDTVILLSAIVHQKEKKSMEAKYFDVNYKLAIAIAEKAKQNKVKYFVFISTAAVFHPNSTCISQDTVPNPTTFYGMSKLAAENALIKMKSLKFKVAIVRLPMVYGEGSKGNYDRLVKIAKYLPILPEYHNKRSMIHIDYLCEKLEKLIENESEGYFFLQDSKYIDTCAMIVLLRKQMGRKTIKTNKLNFVIKVMIRYNKIIRKVIGDFYYVESDFVVEDYTNVV